MTFPHTGKNEWPFIIGHRGGAGAAFENSLAAFANAAGTGDERCDGVELDIHASSDGALVVHHDPILRSGRAISNMPLAEVRREHLPDGSSIPTLPEVLAIVEDLEVFIEVKNLAEKHDERLLTLATSAPHPERLHVHSFDHRIVARLKSKAPALSTGVLSCSYPVDPLAQVRAARANTLWQSWELIDRPLVERCAAESVSLIAWTVNEASQAARLTALGVTMLCGNWPSRLRQPLPR